MVDFDLTLQLIPSVAALAFMLWVIWALEKQIGRDRHQRDAVNSQRIRNKSGNLDVGLNFTRYEQRSGGMRLKKLTMAAMCMVCATAFADQWSLHGHTKNGISRMFLDARTPDQPPRYSRSEIKKMIHDAKTAEDFDRLADYFDYQSLEFQQKADVQVKELERLLALRFHARTYSIQLDYARELIKEYRSKANECSARATAYRANTQP